MLVSNITQRCDITMDLINMHFHSEDTVHACDWSKNKKNLSGVLKINFIVSAVVEKIGSQTG